jgi:uncharacterized protein DUF3617
MEFFMTRVRTAAVVAALSALGLGALASAQAAKGDLWEVTSQPSMEGMPMRLPSSTAKVCSAKEWREPPNGQKNCKSTNMKIDGTKVTWDVQCTGPAMTGHGEITREGATAYSGSIKMSSDQGNMTIMLSGKKTGECDNPQ